MRRVDVRTVLLVATKELLESIRDRRTLFVALVLPVLIYPIVTLGLGPVITMQKRKLAEAAQKVALTGPDAPALRERVFVPAAPAEGGEPRPPALEVVGSEDPRRDLAAGDVQLWVDVPEGFDEALAGDGTAEVAVHYDASDDLSRTARDKWDAAFAAAERRVMAARLERQGLPPGWREPLRQDVRNVAPPERTAAFVFGRVLAMILVLMTLTSSFYPAVDVVAGEKERGTMETLLVAPCGRTELVLGKFGAVLAVTLAAALLNLGSLALTTGPFLGALGQGAKMPALEITWPVIGGILCLLVPLAALFSAVSLSLSTLARSVKEGQHYLSPLVMLVLPMALVVMLPNVPLTRTLAAVPVTNAVLFFRDLMLGRTEWGTTVIVMASTFGFAALAIWSSVLLFLREETLFRGPEGTGAPLRRPAPTAVPSAPAAVFLFAASLAGLWYAQGLVARGGVVESLLVTQLLVVAGPCLALAWWLRVDADRTFRVARPTRGAWLATALAAPLGVALVVVSAWIQFTVAGPPAQGSEMERFSLQLQEVIAGQPWWLLALLFGVLPALCEELFYRGFVLTSLEGAWRRPRGPAAAVAVTAAFFATSHIYPEKWTNTFVMGLVLGALALRTGSLLPGLVAHAAHNAAIVLASKYEWTRTLFGEGDAPDAGRAAAAAGVTALLLAATYAATRREAAGAAQGT